MPASLRAGTAWVTPVEGGGFRRAPESAWSREEVESAAAYPGIRFSGIRALHGRPTNVWKVGDQYFAQYASENPISWEVVLVGVLGLAAVGTGIWLAMPKPAPAPTPAPASTPTGSTG